MFRNSQVHHQRVHEIIAQKARDIYQYKNTKEKLYTTLLIIKPTRCTNFSNLFLEWNPTCFGHFLCPSSAFHCTHNDGICHSGLLTACEQDQDGSQAVSKPVWHIPLLCVQWKTPDDGQRKCPKHVEFYSENNFGKISVSGWFYYKNPRRVFR